MYVYGQQQLEETTLFQQQLLGATASYSPVRQPVYVMAEYSVIKWTARRRRRRQPSSAPDAY